MKLRKVMNLPPPGKDGAPGPQGIPGPIGPMGPPGRDGRDGRDGKVITEVVEKVLDFQEHLDELQRLKKELEKLAKRRPEYIGGSSPAVTKYLVTEVAETHFRKDSFLEGMNIIGVRYAGAATVYLPNNLDPTMVVTVKDESGSGDITVLIEG